MATASSPSITAQEALEVVEQSLPGSLDLILCDLMMPQMDGNELVRRAKQLHPGLPAMIVSGTVNAFDRAVHADVFLPKGACSAAEMIERIRVLVARKRGPKSRPIFAASDISPFAHATPASQRLNPASPGHILCGCISNGAPQLLEWKRGFRATREPSPFTSCNSL